MVKRLQARSGAEEEVRIAGVTEGGIQECSGQVHSSGLTGSDGSTRSQIEGLRADSGSLEGAPLI